ncbi:RecQ-mediated genome instability protein 1 [Psilocybe cubensis]|uniref:RecQ-mediated genome instability protein 1 n=2 Tax=Psilocybe cubensis TaxID=181762 RepID=A0A8H7Y3E5_PSICU|nr:RecQ-mediated genome instability protein 1 [Psilocybe cubensis]KAH9481602.1 RecQ-mediated genome instability protein 1 [Psilocybe cubensis]
MPPSLRVSQWLDQQFQKPRVDPEWLEGCTEWLEGDQNISPVSQFSEFMDKVKGQLLESDLIDSMLPGTGLDAHISTLSGCLSGPPVLVQITAITEIGSSAFQLDQIRTAREERKLAGVGNEEGEEDGDIEVEGEGPMPKYPRGMLRFQLTDGATLIEAMEYRRIPQLTLGTTPLGFKMQLKGTKFQNGMAMLEPTTIVLLGGKQAELEANQNLDFKRGLYARLGRPLTPVTQNPEPAQYRYADVPGAARSPLRDISPPPLPAQMSQHDDDIEMEPRRRIPVDSSLNRVPNQVGSDNSSRDRAIAALPSRQNWTKADCDAQTNRITPRAERATLVFAGSQSSKSTTSEYFNGNSVASGSNIAKLRSQEINNTVQNLDFNLEPTGRQLSHTLPSPDYFSDVDQFDFDLLDDVDRENQQPISTNKEMESHGPSSVPQDRDIQDASSDDYGMDDLTAIDTSFLEACDKIEKDAITKTGFAHPSSSTNVPFNSNPCTSLVSPPLSTVASSGGASRIVDVIEINDSDEDVLEADDKENAPVATRHVRRRTDTNSRPSRSQSHRSQNTLKKPGQPIVLATNPDDIIDISDSD